jgi:hypothetical protein
MYSVIFNFYGVIKDNKWTWANCIDGTNDMVIKQIHKIKKNNILFKDHNNSLMKFYYNFLTNNMIELDENKIKLIDRLLIYLNKDLFILSPTKKNKMVLYIGINKIKENYV